MQGNVIWRWLPCLPQKTHNTVVLLWRSKAHHTSLSASFWYLKGDVLAIGYSAMEVWPALPVSVNSSDSGWIWPMERPEGRGRLRLGTLIILLLAGPWVGSVPASAKLPSVHTHSLWILNHSLPFSVLMPWLFLGFCIVDFSKLCLHLCKDSFY